MTRPVVRPRLDTPSIRISVRINSKQAEFLALWGNNPTQQINDLLDRAIKFWPAGPNKFGHKASRSAGLPPAGGTLPADASTANSNTRTECTIVHFSEKSRGAK